MRVLIAFFLGLLIGAGAAWYYGANQAKSGTASPSPGQQLEDTAKSARDAVEEKLRVLDLRPNEVKEDLARTGQVIRRKAREAGKAIADATADARITTAIKAKLIGDRKLSALSISVNTTSGIVTLSGTVPTTEDISKVMLLAMETDGVREVVSTLQVKPEG